MKTALALIVKFIISFLAVWSTLGFIDNNNLNIITLVAAIITIANYFIGDLLILPNLGNIIASIIDGVMAAIIAYITILFVPESFVSLISGIVLGVLIAVAEYFFHIYIVKADKVAP
ncbi:uncharacterized protein DUF2512 [Natranaerovirga pectinivora]|uniref:Uncharacterized protein DUF2512 n=1 Tax=Natranaerovirga pectinivora TaxID=682400 RepID=A0A4R3MGL6_9FIRM|nr:DUF2512 family protein [Natranaerovirga pectinivora]TCT12894.1 uncharacterized protein DUF2512 [Natranaerovirga pectinivora]